MLLQADTAMEDVSPRPSVWSRWWPQYVRALGGDVEIRAFGVNRKDSSCEQVSWHTLHS